MLFDLSGSIPTALARCFSALKWALLLAVGLILGAPLARAVDLNGNGLSDVWEMQFNAAGLDPAADSDQDGVANLQESIAGTNPLDSRAAPAIAGLQRNATSVTIRWPSVADKGYQIFTSSNLAAGSWQTVGPVLYGTGQMMSGTYPLSASSAFYRLQIVDLDSDGDGVSDWEEMMLGLNPYDSYSNGVNADLGLVQGSLQASANTVTAAATDPLASDDGLDPGALTLTRTGRLDPINVAYTVGGTALAGTDYAALSGTASFGVGVNSVTIPVRALATSPNALAGRTIILTVASGPGYTVGTVASATVAIGAKGTANSVVQEIWIGIGTSGSVSYIPTASPPNSTRVLTTLENPSAQPLGTATGTRIRGYLLPPTTGLYTFWIASDDNGQLWISTDDQPVNLIVRAFVSTYTSSRQWTKDPANQKSLPIQLTAGQRYYFEALQKNASSGENLAIGWAKPGEATTAPSEIVPGSALAPYVALTLPGPTVLYYADLTPESGTASTGAGAASVRLSANESTAIVTLTTGGLTSAPAGATLRGPAGPSATGPILFNLSAATPRPDGTYVWNVSDPAQVAALKAGLIYLEVQTAQNPLGELRGQLSRSVGSASFTPPAAPPAWSDDHASANAAARFLTQTTFGANSELIAQIQGTGYQEFLEQQFALPIALHLPFTDVAVSAVVAAAGSASSNQSWESWWRNAVAAPDQLRQRVAFALSEIMVVSDYAAGLDSNPIALSTYYDVLLRNAFGNFRQLIEDVTLSPTMGQYLNMVYNDKPDPIKGTHPNENYARECMQLFTIGLSRLNPDGSLALDSGSKPVATYGQNEVTGVARVFTGWYWPQAGVPSWNYLTASYRAPMSAVPSHHDGAAKPILGNIVLPSGQAQAQDLKDTLDVIFHHPNVGPFIARALIQRLVTANPTPGYVYRVAKVFADNGSGVRGDLQAVLKAIFLDYEARSPVAASVPGFGKQREPAVRMATFYRAFHATAANGSYKIANVDGTVGQTPLHATSVFNYFSPDYSPPGVIASAGLVAPEFQITTDTSVINSSNKMRSSAFQVASSDATAIVPDYTPQLALAGNNAALVDSLNTLLLGGQMSPDMRTAVLNGLAALKTTTTALEKVQTAVHLIISSPQFVIQK